jgi:TatD DNase family protein
MTVFIDSHCHVNFPDLAGDYPAIAQRMAQNKVSGALCVSVNLRDWPQMMQMVEAEPQEANTKKLLPSVKQG